MKVTTSWPCYFDKKVEEIAQPVQSARDRSSTTTYALVLQTIGTSRGSLCTTSDGWSKALSSDIPGGSFAGPGSFLSRTPALKTAELSISRFRLAFHQGEMAHRSERSAVGQVCEGTRLSMPPVRKCWPSGNQAQADVFSLWCCAVCRHSPVRASHSRTCAEPHSHAESVPLNRSGPHRNETAARTILLVISLSTCSADEGQQDRDKHTDC